MRPTFIGIGAQKCASSWIYEMLHDHPQVVVSETKELNFFSYCYENGFRWYESQFVERKGVVAAGEVSPSYLHEPGVVERVHSYGPELRIVVSLRDPVERALSQHRHMVREGLIPDSDFSFESALATNPTYVEQGLFHRHLARWTQAFARERVHVVLMEDIEADSASVVQGLYRFIGVDPIHQPETIEQRRNPSYVIRNAGLHSAIGVARRAVSATMGAGAWNALGNLGLRHAYRSVNRTDSSTVIPPPRPETVRALRERFRPDIEQLEKFLNRDLARWHTMEDVGSKPADHGHQ